MGLRDELETYVGGVLDAQWTRRQGRKVPSTEDLALSNVAVELEATVLYADIAGSTPMVERLPDWLAAEVYKTYLYCVARIVRAKGGSITAYDGDRLMAVFIGDGKNSAAAECALKINWGTRSIVNAKVQESYPSRNFKLEQRVGIDTSELFVTRTGIRGSNDLVWVGTAANNAAKLATLDPRYPSYITADVYRYLNRNSQFGQGGIDMWTDLGTAKMGYRIYGSSWWWEF